MTRLNEIERLEQKPSGTTGDTEPVENIADITKAASVQIEGATQSDAVELHSEDTLVDAYGNPICKVLVDYTGDKTDTHRKASSIQIETIDGSRKVNLMELTRYNNLPPKNAAGIFLSAERLDSSKAYDNDGYIRADRVTTTLELAELLHEIGHAHQYADENFKRITSGYQAASMFNVKGQKDMNPMVLRRIFESFPKLKDKFEKVRDKDKVFQILKRIKDIELEIDDLYKDAESPVPKHKFFKRSMQKKAKKIRETKISQLHDELDQLKDEFKRATAGMDFSDFNWAYTIYIEWDATKRAKEYFDEINDELGIDLNVETKNPLIEKPIKPLDWLAMNWAHVHLGDPKIDFPSDEDELFKLLMRKFTPST